MYSVHIGKVSIFLESYCEDGDLNKKWISFNDKRSKSLVHERYAQSKETKVNAPLIL